MTRRRLLLALVALAVVAQLAYTFIGFHIYFPVLAKNVSRIVTLLEPADLTLYRSYVPAGCDMPRDPAVKVDFVEITPSWHEAFVSIRVSHRGETGWVGVTWPIDSWVPYVLGYWVGYPKFMTEPMRWQPTASGYVGSVQRDRRAFLQLAFTAGPNAALPLDPSLVDDSAAYFNLMPPLRGPQLNRLSNVLLTSNPVRDTRGMVHITVNPDEPWAGLITKGTERSAPGFLLAETGQRFGFLIAERVH